MDRVQVGLTSWGVVWATDGVAATGGGFRLKLPQAGQLVAINTTVYAAPTGGTTVAPASFVSDENGVLPGWVEQGSYTLTVGGVPMAVEAIAGSVAARTLVLEGDAARLSLANTFAADMAVGPLLGGSFRALYVDSANKKLYTPGLILREEFDTADLGFQRYGPNNGTPGTPHEKLLESDKILRIYWQAAGDNGPWGLDVDTPTSGQHQAANIAAQLTQDASFLTTTTSSGAIAGATTLALASVAGLGVAGEILVRAADASNVTVHYTSISGSTLQNVTGIDRTINSGASVWSFTRGTQLTFNTTPNGTSENREVMTLGQDGLLSLKVAGISTQGPVVIKKGFLQMTELAAAPSDPNANEAIIYAEDNGAGKARVMLKFATGAAIVLGTQP